MKTKKLIDSVNLREYKIKGRPKTALDDATEMRSYAAKANRELPAFIRLFREDWKYIDEQVRAQSDNKYNASTVQWDGMALKRPGDA